MIQNFFTRQRNSHIFHKIGQQFKFFETHLDIFAVNRYGMRIFIQTNAANIQAAFHIQLIRTAQNSLHACHKDFW